MFTLLHYCTYDSANIFFVLLYRSHIFQHTATVFGHGWNKHNMSMSIFFTGIRRNPKDLDFIIAVSHPLNELPYGRRDR